MRLLISGGCGFLGSNLAEEALRRGHELFVFDNLGRLGSSQNLEWLKTLGNFRFLRGDIRSLNEVRQAVEESTPDAVFHLAGQVAMTTSIQDPRLDFEINTVGTHNMLECLRTLQPHATLIYSSTNKVYGDLENLRYDESSIRYTALDYPHGFDEFIPLDFRSPYGCSKGAADQYILDYARIYKMNTVVFRHSSIFGYRQFSTNDQGWIGWFVGQALKRKSGRLADPLTISGNGKQVRDILFSSDLVRLYFNALTNIEKARGQAFNIGGGMANSLSLIELFNWLSQEFKVDLPVRCLPPRQSDQKVFVANITKANELLDWSPRIMKEEGLVQMVRWVDRA